MKPRRHWLVLIGVVTAWVPMGAWTQQPGRAAKSRHPVVPGKQRVASDGGLVSLGADNAAPCPARRVLRPSDPGRGQACRSACRASDDVQAVGESQDRDGAWPDHPVVAAAARTRSFSDAQRRQSSACDRRGQVRWIGYACRDAEVAPGPAVPQIPAPHPDAGQRRAACVGRDQRLLLLSGTQVRTGQSAAGEGDRSGVAHRTIHPPDRTATRLCGAAPTRCQRRRVAPDRISEAPAPGAGSHGHLAARRHGPRTGRGLPAWHGRHRLGQGPLAGAGVPQCQAWPALGRSRTSARRPSRT